MSIHRRKIFSKRNIYKKVPSFPLRYFQPAVTHTTIAIMSFPTSLPLLNDREAIEDALYRCFLGFDTGDANLFDSAFVSDATFKIMGNEMKGLSEIHVGSFDKISKLDTTHHLSNIRVNLETSTNGIASVTATSMAQHFRGGEGNKPDTIHLMSGGFSFIEVVKDRGTWKIKSLDYKLIWTEGDWGVFN